MRRAARVDSNQAEIVDALRKAGCSVALLHQLGSGVPDLLVGCKGKDGPINLLMEVKDGNKSPWERRLTADELEWHEGWRGQVQVVESAEHALAVVRHHRGR